MSQRYELRRLMLIWMQRCFPVFHKFVSLSTHFRLLNISFLLTPLSVDQSHYQLPPIDRFGSIRITFHQSWKLWFVMNIHISRSKNFILVNYHSRLKGSISTHLNIIDFFVWFNFNLFIHPIPFLSRPWMKYLYLNGRVVTSKNWMKLLFDNLFYGISVQT